MKFVFLSPDDFPGKTELEVSLEVRELLRVLVNELRAVRALHLALPDPEDLPDGEGGKEP